MGSSPDIPPPPPPPAPPPPPTATAERAAPARKTVKAKSRKRGVSALTIRRPSVNIGGGTGAKV